MSETAGDDEDLEHLRFIRMRAEDTFSIRTSRMRVISGRWCRSEA